MLMSKLQDSNTWLGHFKRVNPEALLIPEQLLANEQRFPVGLNWGKEAVFATSDAMLDNIKVLSSPFSFLYQCFRSYNDHPLQKNSNYYFFSELRKLYQRIRSDLILASLCLLITFTHEATGGIDKQLMRQGKPMTTKIQSELIKMCDQSHGSVAGWFVW